jgi:Flp pilus assembly protein TadG
MLRRTHNRRPRRGVTLVEAAIIYPLLFFLLLGLVIGGMGIYRYQEVAALARSAARYASTHGAQFRKDTGQSVGTPGTSAGGSNNTLWYQASPTGASGSDTSWTGDIYDSAARPQLIALDPNNLTFQVGWPMVTNPSGTVVQNKPDNWPGSSVTVTVSYQWLPELYLIGPITLTSTSTMPVTN